MAFTDLVKFKDVRKSEILINKPPTGTESCVSIVPVYGAMERRTLLRFHLKGEKCFL